MYKDQLFFIAFSLFSFSYLHANNDLLSFSRKKIIKKKKKEKETDSEAFFSSLFSWVDFFPEKQNNRQYSSNKNLLFTVVCSLHSKRLNVEVLSQRNRPGDVWYVYTASKRFVKLKKKKSLFCACQSSSISAGNRPVYLYRRNGDLCMGVIIRV